MAEMEVCSRDELVTGGSSVVKHKSSLLVQQELHCYQSEVTTASKKIDELDGVIRRKKTTKKRPQSRRIGSLDSELSQYRLSVNFHRERVSVYSGKLEELGEAMADVCQRMDRNVDKMSSLEAGQAETGSKMDALAKNLESSFKEASELVSSLKEQNELLASSLQESTEYLTSTNQLLHEANRKVEEANRRVSDLESKFERLMEEVRKSRSDARRDLDGPKLEAFEREVREELNSKNKRRLNCCVCS